MFSPAVPFVTGVRGFRHCFLSLCLSHYDASGPQYLCLTSAVTFIPWPGNDFFLRNFFVEVAPWQPGTGFLPPPTFLVIV